LKASSPTTQRVLLLPDIDVGDKAEKMRGLRLADTQEGTNTHGREVPEVMMPGREETGRKWLLRHSPWSIKRYATALKSISL